MKKAGKKWLKKGSPAFIALQKILEDKRRLADVSKLTDFCHTGSLENLHSLMTMLCPKRVHFFFDSMHARTQLAMIHHNYNLHREQAKTKTGIARWRVVFPKSKKQWVAKKIYDKSSSQYLFDLMAMVKDVQEQIVAGETPACQRIFEEARRSVPDNIATLPNPGKETVVSNYVSRFLL